MPKTLLPPFHHLSLREARIIIVIMTQYVTRRSQIPGSRFTPSNLELINYLRRKKERGKSSSFIPDMDVYEEVPWLLQHVRHFRSKENEWYYFVTRRNRTVGCFTWRSTAKTSIYKDGVTVGYMRSLAFSLDGMATGWVMHEFFLNRSGKEKVVLCRIRFTLRDDNSQYAPRFESRVIGQPQPPRREEAAREDGLTLVENKKNNLYVGIASGSCPREDVSDLSAQRQQLRRQYSNYAMNGNMEQHHDFGFCGQFLGVQKQNEFWGQETNPSHSVQAMEVQQWNKYYDLLYHQGMVPVTQGMMEHQDFGFYAPLGGFLAQNHHSLVPMETQQDIESQQRKNTCLDLDVFENLAAQQQQHYLRQASNVSVTQQGMTAHQDFSFYASQCLGGDLAQNHHSVVPTETPQGMEPQQQQKICLDPRVVENLKAQQQQKYLMEDSKFSGTQQGMIKHQEFGSSGESSGGDLAQNHLLVVPLETQQGMERQQQENVVENQTTDPSYLTQGQKQQHCEQATDLPINQRTDEPHRSTTSSFSHNELIQQSLGEMDKMANFEKWAQQDLGDMDDMANFGNAEWALHLGENTPEEEAELQAELGNCKTTASLFNYFCPM
ncbi:NAC domain superfamily [Arabidopsis thaliana x Arabidopsis arenosa]|uniref:NAC domain superfamily n=1 Tax=Arabidopsis thaliana x Arabidopsis arenosa TaxID=1240361 RepID=A0A8T1Z2A2_9BRAS|nr:NAC domain superfamily [Arabidopsis thaliana x Arabidopsis arenosa]